MAKVEIKFSTDNAAFDDGMATEIGRILRKLAGQVESEGITTAVLKDLNGNTVGNFDHYGDIQCPSCRMDVGIKDMTVYQGERMCEGCAQSTDDQSHYDDPHGRGWQN